MSAILLYTSKLINFVVIITNISIKLSRISSKRNTTHQQSARGQKKTVTGSWLRRGLKRRFFFFFCFVFWAIGFFSHSFSSLPVTEFNMVRLDLL